MIESNAPEAMETPQVSKIELAISESLERAASRLSGGDPEALEKELGLFMEEAGSELSPRLVNAVVGLKEAVVRSDRETYTQVEEVRISQNHANETLIALSERLKLGDDPEHTIKSVGSYVHEARQDLNDALGKLEALRDPLSKEVEATSYISG